MERENNDVGETAKTCRLHFQHRKRKPQLHILRIPVLLWAWRHVIACPCHCYFGDAWRNSIWYLIADIIFSMTNLGKLSSVLVLLILLLDHFSKTLYIAWVLKQGQLLVTKLSGKELSQRFPVSFRGNSKHLSLFRFCFRCNFVISVNKMDAGHSHFDICMLLK